ncbi:MAG TPA: 2-dehydropantoate 2-reductase [Clostridia bacterium]
MKFLIIGTGGTGGSIGGFLALNNHDVTFIARGAHLEEMKKNGLKLRSGLKGDIRIPNIKACEGDEYNDKADVIFVCVKSYSIDEIIPLIRRASHSNTIVIPVLNGIGIGDKIYDSFNDALILDGCIYIVAYVVSPGEIAQDGGFFKIVFGERENQKVPDGKMEELKEVLEACGIKAEVSDNIKHDTMQKYSFISPFASCGVYYDITAKDMQHDGEYRQMFIKLFNEIKSISYVMGIKLKTNIEDNLKILDKLTLDATASLQKDFKAGKRTEIDGLIFEVVRLSEKYNVSVPNYKMIAKKLGY